MSDKKKLLYMIISGIAVNKLIKIDWINITLEYNLINYLSNEEGIFLKGYALFFLLRNVGIKTLNRDIKI